MIAKNNQNSIKSYFLKSQSDIKNIPIQESGDTVTYSPYKFKSKQLDISKGVEKPALARAMKALQISNPFKGV